MSENYSWLPNTPAGAPGSDVEVLKISRATGVVEGLGLRFQQCRSLEEEQLPLHMTPKAHVRIEILAGYS